MKYIISIIILLIACSSLALQVDQKLDDLKLEKRALKIFRNVKCPTCPSQSIADSETSSAAQLRIFIREHLSKSETDSYIEELLIKKYGREILLTPTFTYKTCMLWFFPLIFFGIITTLFYRKNIDKY